MRICVFGAGAVGSHFAVRLALAGHDVSCVMRGPHLDAVKANGLTLRSGDNEFNAKVKASDDPAKLGPQDFVISTLKATALGSLVTGLTPLLNASDTPWCSRRTAFPGGTTSVSRAIIRRRPISASLIPAVNCARRRRESASSAA